MHTCNDNNSCIKLHNFSMFCNVVMDHKSFINCYLNERRKTKHKISTAKIDIKKSVLKINIEHAFNIIRHLADFTNNGFIMPNNKNILAGCGAGCHSCLH